MAIGDPEAEEAYDVLGPDLAGTLGGLSDAPEFSPFLAALGKGITSIVSSIISGIKSIFGGFSGAPVPGAVAAERAPVIAAKANISSVLNDAGFRAAIKIGIGGINATVSLANGAVVPVGFRLDSAINAMSKLPQASVAFNTLQSTCQAAFTSQGLSLSVVNGHIEAGLKFANLGFSISSAGVPNLSITAQGGILQSAPPIKQPNAKPESEGSDDSVKNAILVAAIAATIAAVIASRGKVNISARITAIGKTMFKTQIGGVSGNWEIDPQAAVLPTAITKPIETAVTAVENVVAEGVDYVSDIVEKIPVNYNVA